GVGDRCRKRLEQAKPSCVRDLTHERSHVLVVHGVVQQIVSGLVGEIPVEVVDERPPELLLLVGRAVVTEDLEPDELDDYGHAATALAAYRASTCSRTSWARMIVAPRS